MSDRIWGAIKTLAHTAAAESRLNARKTSNSCAGWRHETHGLVLLNSHFRRGSPEDPHMHRAHAEYTDVIQRSHEPGAT